MRPKAHLPAGKSVHILGVPAFGTCSPTERESRASWPTPAPGHLADFVFTLEPSSCRQIITQIPLPRTNHGRLGPFGARLGHIAHFPSTAALFLKEAMLRASFVHALWSAEFHLS